MAAEASTIVGVAINVLQQVSGINVFIYFAPQCLGRRNFQMERCKLVHDTCSIVPSALGMNVISLLMCRILEDAGFGRYSMISTVPLGAKKAVRFPVGSAEVL